MCFPEKTRVLDELPSGPGYCAAGPGFLLTSNWQTKSGVVRQTHKHKTGLHIDGLMRCDHSCFLQEPWFSVRDFEPYYSA